MVLLGVTELGVNLPSLVAYLVNFILLLGILGVFAYKPLMRMLDERTERIRESLEAADLARQEAANAQEAIQEQITEARREGQRIMDQTREAAERFRTEEMERHARRPRPSWNGPERTSNGSGTPPSKRFGPVSAT